MKHYKEIIEEMKSFRKTESAFDRRTRYAEMFRNAVTTEEKLEIAKQEDEENKRDAENDLYYAVLKHNLEVAYITELLPIVCEVYQKYAGKRIGEKTSKKIDDEIKTATGEHVYCNNDGMRLYPYNCNTVTLYFGMYNDPSANYGKTNYKMYDSEGKLNKLTPEMFIYHKQYIDDIPAYIEEKRELAEKIKELCNQLEEARTEFDENLPDGLYRLDYGKVDTYFKLRTK